MKIGILGAGAIVPDFLLSVQFVKAMEPVAIFGHDTPKACGTMQGLAGQYGLTKLYFKLEDILGDEELDCIYIALPNHLHHEFGKKALEAGKHVIVEKPFTASYAQAAELVALARERGLFLFDTTNNIHFPNFYKITELLNRVGDVKIVELNTSQYSRRYDKFRQGDVHASFDAKKAGGAMMDLQVYNINFMLRLFGLPTKTSYIANVERGIDTSGILILEYPTFKCVSIAAKDSRAPSGFHIQGNAGYIHSDTPCHIMTEASYTPNGGVRESHSLNQCDTFARLQFELQDFYKIWETRDFAARDEYLDHTLQVAKILDDSRKNAGIET